MRLNIIITSTRPNRIGPHIGKWFYEYAKENNEGFEVVLTDLADVGLPLYDEPNHPTKQQYVHEHTKRWSKIVSESDAFVFILPEYNFTAPPSFINAIDFLYNEWNYKAAGFVSYGGISGGLRSTQTAKTLLTSVFSMPVYEQVAIPNVFGLIEGDKFNANEHHISSAKAMMQSLAKWSKALEIIRNQ